MQYHHQRFTNIFLNILVSVRLRKVHVCLLHDAIVAGHRRNGVFLPQKCRWYTESVHPDGVDLHLPKVRRGCIVVAVRNPYGCTITP